MSAEERRARSRERLVGYGVPVAAGPAPQRDESARLPEPKDALQRAMCLALTGMVGDGLDQESAALDLDRLHLRSCLTPDEAAFLTSESPNVHRLAAYSWRKEGALAILWALGIIQHLDGLDPDAATTEIERLLADETLDEQVAKTSYRPISEILDEEDLYRLYSAAYASVVSPGVALGAEPQVGPVPLPAVNERLRALEWLARRAISPTTGG